MGIRELSPHGVDNRQDIEPVPQGIHFERFFPARKLSVPHDLLPLYGRDPEKYPYRQKLGPENLYEADPETETYVAESLAENMVRRTGITPDVIIVTASHLPPFDLDNPMMQRRANHVRSHLRTLDLNTSVASEDPSNTRTISTACSGAVVGLDLLKKLDGEDGKLHGQSVLFIAEETGYRRTLQVPSEDGGKSGLLFSDAAIAMQFTYGQDLMVVSSMGPQYEKDETRLFMRTPDYLSDDPYLEVLRPPYGEYFDMNGPSLLRHFGQKISLESIIDNSIPHINPETIDFVLTHQASARMVDNTFNTLGFPNARGYGRGIYEYGNTSSASTLYDLADGLRDGEIVQGDNVLMVGYGAGLTWGAAVVSIGS